MQPPTNPTQIWQDIQKIRTEAPLVHNITNYVVMNTTANALLALGASPVMAHAPQEVEEMTALSGALVLNIGTLSEAWIASMLKAGSTAKQRNIPVILDPVGCGATTYRTTTARNLLTGTRPTIIRGNASEIRALHGNYGNTRGVDSTCASEGVQPEAQALAQSDNCVVSVSGPVDLVVKEGNVLKIANGSPIMTRVTGMGCTSTAITGAFAAVNPDPFLAAVHAMVVMGIAGEIAAERSAGPGSFWPAFLDALHHLHEDGIRSRVKMQHE